jgi:hypothetical protein
MNEHEFRSEIITGFREERDFAERESVDLLPVWMEDDFRPVCLLRHPIDSWFSQFGKNLAHITK